MAIVPAMAYAMAFSNEAGIASYYGLPIGVISVGIPPVVIPLQCVAFFTIYVLITSQALHAETPFGGDGFLGWLRRRS